MNVYRTRNRRQHVIDRARERWDILLTVEDVEGLDYVLSLGLGRRIERRKKRRGAKCFVTTLGGVEIPVIFDSGSKKIVTVLGPHAKEVLRRWEAKQAKAGLTTGNQKQTL